MCVRAFVRACVCDVYVCVFVMCVGLYIHNMMCVMCVRACARARVCVYVWAYICEYVRSCMRGARLYVCEYASARV